jgi:Uma2 family endonuclease
MSFEIKEPAIALNRFYSIEEFLDYVEPKNAKYELLLGELMMMAGSTIGHALIRNNVSTSLKSNFDKKGCITLQESVYLKVIHEDLTLFLPDVMVTWDTKNLDLKSRFVVNPTIIVEILSESTERYDRGEKWAHYRKIPSLKYYILVSQSQPKVEVYGRPHAQSLFYLQDFEGLDAIVDLKILDIQIPMRNIYEGIAFETETPNP